MGDRDWHLGDTSSWRATYSRARAGLLNGVIKLLRLTLNIRVDRPLQRQPRPLDKLGLSFLDADGPEELEHRSLPPPGRRGFFVGPFPWQLRRVIVISSMFN